MFPARLRQGIARAAQQPTTGLRAVHTSNMVKRASSPNDGAADASSTQQPANPPKPAAATPSMMDFFKSIRMEPQNKAATPASQQGAGAGSSDVKLNQVAQILEMLKPVASGAQQPQQAGARRLQKDSPSQLFEILFPTQSGAATGAAGAKGGHATGQETLHKIFASTFNASRKRTEDFKYWSIFPKQIKKWLIYTRTPKGFYGDNGKWLPAFQQGMITTPKSDAQRDAEFKYHTEKYQQEQMLLPEDLRGQFRMGITPQEVADLKLHPKLKRIFSFKNATASEINQFRAKRFVAQFGYHIADTGNSAVQVAMLTMRINNLLARAKKHVTDRHNKFRLNNLLHRRRSLLKHLKRANLELYYTTLKAISLKDSVEIYPTKFV